MPDRRLRCAIEQVADLHPHLFVEPHIVAFVAVVQQYSKTPALFKVDCDGIHSRWLGKDTRFRLEVSWHRDTAAKAERMRSTMQAGPLVELAAIALALIICKRVLPMGPLDVTDYGERADFLANRRKLVLEISGTQAPSELARRHQEKIRQAGQNPLGWDACVVVCAFSNSGHRIRFSKHSLQEAVDVKSQD